MNIARRILLVGVAAALCAHPVAASGPLIVNGAGSPLVWGASPVPFNPDRGTLGTLANGAAVANVTANFAVWTAVPTSVVSFTDAGLLPTDVTAANYESYIGVCGDGLNPIIFDTDGSITDALFGQGARNDILGFAGPDCGSLVPPVITEGSAILNGRWVDGIVSPTNPEIPLADFNGVFVHEFGHYVNLDHSQVNRLEADDGDPGNDGAVATMYPFLVSGTAAATLALDDVVSVSRLYPAPSFASSFGRITGRVLRSDGTTHFQGAYVIARRSDDPRNLAVGMASGAFYFPAQPGGPPSPTLRGFYELAGLPAGSWTVEIEAIDPSFTGGSSVGPLDPPAALPGPAEFWSGATEAGANPPDDPTLAAPVSVTAGATQTNIDVILNAIPPAANDTCAAATVVVPPFLNVVNTTAATTVASDPLQACTFGGPSRNEASVWYRFTPASTSTVVVDTLGSDYDTVLSVHSGGCAVLTPVACNDDAGNGLQSALTFVATAGTSYLIEVTAYEGTPGGKLELALDVIPGCGDGVVGGSEACDAGAANGSDGCCGVTCTLVDGDGDGRCDRDDVCPGVADPGQPDGDGDGIGDACDACRTTVPGQTAWIRPRLVASGVDGFGGNDRLRLVGQFRLATGGFTVDPLANGASVELRAGSGLPRVVAVLPPGPFDSPGPGWTRSTSGNRYTFRDASGQSALGGSSRLVVKDRGGGLVQVVLSASRTSLGLATEDAPLAATVVLGGALAGTNGECGEVAFPGPPPALACRVSTTGTRIVCD